MKLISKGCSSSTLKYIMGLPEYVFFVLPDVIKRKGDWSDSSNIKIQITKEVRDMYNRIGEGVYYRYVEGLSILLDEKTGDWYKLYGGVVLNFGKKESAMLKKINRKIARDQEDNF